jgi:hypothetical protein
MGPGTGGNCPMKSYRYEEIQVRKLHTEDTVTRQSLVDGLEEEACGDWLTILLITKSPATVILTVYDPDTRREMVWSGDPLHTVYRSTDL